jgi:hypothetical protein
MASIVYGEPRFTNDIDVVIRSTEAQVDQLCQAFPHEDYYVSADAAREAVRQRAMFNVIHPASGLKIDFIVAGGDEFNHSRFARRRRLPVVTGARIAFASPEDVIIRKLQYFREGRSEKHVGDIRGILSTTDQEIDRAYLTSWIERLGLQEEWKRVTGGA